MEVFVNNKPIELAATAGLADVFTALGVSSANGIAIAVNNLVVPGKDWAALQLVAGDKITIIKATQGG